MRQGWEIKKLGEVCEIINGGTPDTTVPKYWDGENLWITPKDMGKLDDIYVYDTSRKITDAGLKNSSAKILPTNSIILSSRAPIGHLAINKKPVSTNQGCKGIVPQKKVSTLYLYYFLSKSVDLLNSLGTGATFKELSSSKLAAVEMSLPLLPEQQHIVAILNEAFASIAKAKSNAEQNLKNVRELFENYLESIFENKDHVCEEKRLVEVCEIRPPKSEARNKLKRTDLVSFVPMEDLGVSQKIFIPAKERRLNDVEGSYTYFADEDVLLAKITPCFENGKLGIARDLTNGIGFGSSEFIVFRVSGNLYSEFLYYYLLRERFRIKGAERMLGAVGHKRVSKEYFDNSLIPLPSITTQKSIVQKLDALSAETKKLEGIYQQKLNALEELKKSILQKAFNGEL